MDSPTAFFYPKITRKWAQNGRFEAFTTQLFPYERGSPPGEGRGIVNEGCYKMIIFVKTLVCEKVHYSILVAITSLVCFVAGIVLPDSNTFFYRRSYYWQTI